MRKIIIVKLVILAFLIGFYENVSAKAKAKNKIKTQQKSSVLNTEFYFEGLPVHGKYQTAGEAIATVEDEKVIEDLLGVRMDFKDRIKLGLGKR